MNITITGNLGSGKSSIAKILKTKGFEIVSTGNIFRQLAMDKGLSVEEFNRQVNEAAKNGDRSVDNMIDDMTSRLGKEKDNVVFDSRLAWHFAPDSFKVFVITDIDEASRRVFNDSKRAGSEAYDSLQSCKKALINRQKLETVRYKEIYGIDYYDMSNYNLVIESTAASPDELTQEILQRLEDYKTGKFKKIMELNPGSIKPDGSDSEKKVKPDDTDTGVQGFVCVNERAGRWTLAKGREALDEALNLGKRFVEVKVVCSDMSDEDSFMNFSKME